MTISAFLYSVSILPLELAYKYLYVFLSELAGNYGIALIGLSFVSSVLFVPLKRMVMALQAREAAVQKVMAPQLAAIKRESRGRERQARIRALYRRYAYNPLMALRSSVGILLQVPFLCAAYYMIGSFEPIRGLAWGVIPDLSAPDGLLGGINALPLLMTACNLGALYTAPGFARRDRLQGAAVAALFLVLLYAAPSALLVYWTGNNALMLLGNVWQAFVPERIAGWARDLYATERPFITFAPAGKQKGLKGLGFSSVYAALSGKGEAAVYALSVFVAGLLVLVATPLALYFSEPDFFAVSARAIMGAMLPYLLLWLLLCAALRVATPVPARPVLTFAALAVALAALVNTTLLTGDYGAINGTLLEKARNLDAASGAFIDIAMLFGLIVLIAAVFHFRQGRKLTLALAATAFFLCADAALGVFGDDTPFRVAGAGGEEAAQARREFFSLSGTEPNVLIFFLDMFTGGHVEQILAEDPALTERLDGFTWYPDTMSPGFATSFSAPGIFGGPDFTPGKLNQRPETTLLRKFSEAVAVLPRHFGERGFDTGLLHPIYPLDRGILERRTAGHMPRILGKPDLRGIRSEWEQKIGLDDTGMYSGYFTDFLFSVGLFKAAPRMVKKSVYREGEWLFESSRSVTGAEMGHILYESAALGLLPEMFRADASRPTFRFFYSTLPHMFWRLPLDSLIPVEDPFPETKGQAIRVNGVVPEHVYTEIHVMRMLANFFDWLRAEGAFDNTMIILVSDHCEADSKSLRAAMGIPVDGWRDRAEDDPYEYPGRPHALLMVKPFGDNAPFRTGDELMSSVDVPAIACRAIGGCPGLEEPYTGPDRVREHYFDADWRQIEVEGRTVYSPAKKAVVRGSMFRKENWTIPRGPASARRDAASLEEPGGYRQPTPNGG